MTENDLIQNTDQTAEPPLRGMLWTVVPVSDDIIKKVTASIEHIVHHKVILETGLRPELIAGFQVELGNRVYDCSLDTQIQSMQKQMNETAIGDLFKDIV